MNTPLVNKAMSKLGFSELKPMQKEMLLAAEKHDNIQLHAPTGSGKTLGFSLPMLDKIVQQGGSQCMIIAPSRELALQITSVWQDMKTGLNVLCCYGGHDRRNEARSLSNAPEVIIGTPGRLADHCRNERFSKDSLNLVVVDEYDKALELGFEEDINTILEYLDRVEKHYLVSATDQIVLPQRWSALDFFKIAGAQQSLATQLEKFKLIAPKDEKTSYLERLLGELDLQQGIIFFNHREAVERVSDFLDNIGLPHETFHGGMEQMDREKALLKFRNGSVNYILATDLAARGLDIQDLDFVVHYQATKDEASFIHRNGRTARMSAEGKSFILLSEDEYLPDFAADFQDFSLPSQQRTVSLPLNATVYFGGGKKEKINKVDVLGVLIKQAKLKPQEVGKIDIMDHAAFAAVPLKKIKAVINELRQVKVKGKKVKVDRCW